jgi:hypothetical protein
VDLVSKLATPPTGRPVGKSIMDVWVDSRPTQEQEAILDAARNKAWGHVALLKELVAEGAPNMSDTSFRMWRVKVGYIA